MTTETTISKSMSAAGNMAKYDAACKCLLAEKIILAWIMKYCVAEYTDCSISQIASHCIQGNPQIAETPVMPDETNSPKIHDTGVEDTTITEGTVTFDIRYFALLPHSDRQVRLIINAEAQNDFYPGYPLVKRGIYYCSRMISAQYGTEFTDSHYEKIQKVYSIWLCMNPPEFRKNTITKYAVTQENMFGTVKEPVQNYDLMTVIMICLGKSQETSGNRLLDLLNILFASDMNKNEKKEIMQRDFQIPMSKQIEGRLDDVCNLSKGVWEKGLEKGLEEGLEKGMEKGLEKGILSSIHSLMESMGWSAEQAMDALKIPSDKKHEYLSKLSAFH